MAVLESERSMDYCCRCGAVVFALYDRQRLAIHPGILHQSKRRAIYFNHPRARPAVLLLPSCIAVTHVSVDFSVDLCAAQDIQQEPSHPSLVDGCSVCVLFAVGIETARLHSSNGTAHRVVTR